jgi:NAD(P)-dependent dehydrogenase (short-subunit alcohol dehydrogenase family)
MSGNGRVALVTGGAGAVGLASARRLARMGFAVALADRDAARLALALDALRAEAAAPPLGLALDLTDPAAPREAMRRIGDAFGRLDCLVNNAGRSGARRIGAVDLEEWNAVLALNLTVPMLMAQEAMPFWEARRGGSIVNIGSRTWLSGAGPGYTASKAGLVGLTRSLAVQLGPCGVTVNAVAPSYLGTGFNPGDDSAKQRAEREHIAIGVLDRLATAEDVAGAVAFLASDDARFITGEVIHVAGGAQLAGRPASAEIADGRN